MSAKFTTARANEVAEIMRGQGYFAQVSAMLSRDEATVLLRRGINGPLTTMRDETDVKLNAAMRELMTPEKIAERAEAWNKKAAGW